MMTHCETTGTVHLFDFESGDDTSYRVLFGRLVPRSRFLPGVTIFGVAEGTDALITLVVTSDDISFDIFGKH